MHSIVSDLTHTYLSGLDAAVSGLVEGFYVTGSVGLNDFHLGISDVDFVAVTSQRLSPKQASTLAQVHAHVSRRYPHINFEGHYVTWNDLKTNPLDVPPGPSVHDGRIDPSSKRRRSLYATPLTRRKDALAFAAMAIDAACARA